MKTLFKRITHPVSQTFRSAVQFYRWRKAQRFAAKQIRRVKLEFPGCEHAMNVQTWPAVQGTATGYKVAGVTTIRWGTDGLLASPRPGSGFYVVTRFNQKQLTEKIPLPNGTGITVTRILLTDGVQWAVTVRDDTQMSPPTTSSTVTLVDGGGFIAGYTGGAALTYTATVVESDYEAAPKQPGERVLLVENLVLIELQTGTVQTAN